MASVEDGDISFGDFEFLNENKETVLNHCKMSEKLKLPKMREVFRKRTDDKEVFLQFHSNLSDFWRTCEKFVKGCAF